jgi:hypothetical protein
LTGAYQIRHSHTVAVDNIEQVWKSEFETTFRAGNKSTVFEDSRESSVAKALMRNSTSGVEIITVSVCWAFRVDAFSAFVDVNANLGVGVVEV